MLCWERGSWLNAIIRQPLKDPRSPPDRPGPMPIGREPHCGDGEAERALQLAEKSLELAQVCQDLPRPHSGSQHPWHPGAQPRQPGYRRPTPGTQPSTGRKIGDPHAQAASLNNLALIQAARPTSPPRSAWLNRLLRFACARATAIELQPCTITWPISSTLKANKRPLCNISNRLLPCSVRLG